MSVQPIVDGKGDMPLYQLEGKPLLHPIRNLLYSKKFIIAVLGVVIMFLSGATPETIASAVEKIVLMYFSVNGIEGAVSIYKNGN